MKNLLLALVVVPLFAFACSGSSEEVGGDGDEDGDKGTGGFGTGGTGTGGTGGTGTGGTGTGGGNADAVAAFIANYCAALMPCCAEVALPTDGAACRALFSANFATGDYGFDQAAANECSAWLETLGGTELCGDSPTVPAACQSAFTPLGNGAPGASCDTPGDCAFSSEGEMRCMSNGLDGQNFCQLVMDGIVGSAPCGWSKRGDTSWSSPTFDQPRVYSCDAADGLYCDDTSCVPITPVGSPCFDTPECALGTYCSSDLVCAPQVPTGSPCGDEFSQECLHGSCLNGTCSGADLGIAFLCGGDL